MADSSINNIEKAKAIALSDLRACYFDRGIFASPVNFSDYWARDSFWAAFGILAVGDSSIVRKSLELFLSYQKPSGDLPRKIALDWNTFKYVFKKSIPRRIPHPIYRGNIPLSSSKDENSLLLIAFSEYLKKTNDLDFARENYAKLKKTMEWYGKKMKNGFVREFILSNWMDTIFKNGNVLYTNVLYCQALSSFSEILATLGRTEEASAYRRKHEEFKKNLKKEFWNGEFFDDERGNRKMFDLAGNVLAVIFDVADKDQARKIVVKAEEIKAKQKKARLHPINHPKHPFWKITPAATVLGIINYQNGISWSWIESLLVVAAAKAGEIETAKNILENISSIIVGNNHLHETYFLDGRPFDHLLWKSAVPFAWGAGLFLWAAGELEKTKDIGNNKTNCQKYFSE